MCNFVDTASVCTLLLHTAFPVMMVGKLQFSALHFKCFKIQEESFQSEECEFPRKSILKKQSKFQIWPKSIVPASSYSSSKWITFYIYDLIRITNRWAKNVVRFSWISSQNLFRIINFMLQFTFATKIANDFWPSKLNPIWKFPSK